MSNTDNVREILVQRYARLSNVSIEKAKSIFERQSIDELIVKHERKLTYSIVLMVLIVIILISQFIALYFFRSIPAAMITNVTVLIVFQRGLHMNYEIKGLLQTWKAMDRH